jgi:XTP/dITP diphosphohydrolase
VDFFEGRLTGQLTFPPRGEKGFGYDPIFVPDGFIQTLAEIEPAVKNKISHRAAAFEGLINTLKYQPI